MRARSRNPARVRGEAAASDDADALRILHHMGARLVFIDDQNREWLVRDGVVQRDRFIPTQLGDHYARFRVFDLRKPRMRKVYRFRSTEQHAVNGATLERQFLEAFRPVERAAASEALSERDVR